MSVAVPPEAIRHELERRANSGYLLTVGDDGRPHCVAVAIRWEDGALVVETGGTSRRNAEARRQVTLLVPPARIAARAADDAADGAAASSEDGYSLIVDGEVTSPSTTGESGGGGAVKIAPTHAVLHRPATTPDGDRGHDCSHIYDEPSAPA